MSIRAAIIGCGSIAGGYDEAKRDGGCYTHAGAYRMFPEVELVAAVDPDPVRREAFGAFWGVPKLYAHAQDFFHDQAVDIISVCVPDEIHEDVIRQILASPRAKVIFAEKPLALSRQGARTMLDQARAAGIRIVLNNQRRFEEGHQRVKALLQAGGIGEIVAVTALYVKGLYHVGSTVIDTIRFLVSEVEAAQAIGGSHPTGLVGDPSVDAALYLRNGATATMLGADRKGYTYHVFELDILGTRGRVRLLDNGDRIIVSLTDDYPHYPGFTELQRTPVETIHAEMGHAIPNGIRQILHALSGQGNELESDGEEGYVDLCVVDAIAESRRQGGKRLPVVL